MCIAGYCIHFGFKDLDHSNHKYFWPCLVGCVSCLILMTSVVTLPLILPQHPFMPVSPISVFSLPSSLHIFLFASFTSIAEGNAKVVHFYLSVCMSVRSRNSWTIAPIDFLYPWFGPPLRWSRTGFGPKNIYETSWLPAFARVPPSLPASPLMLQVFDIKLPINRKLSIFSAVHEISQT